jgi:hypothetical protein
MSHGWIVSTALGCNLPNRKKVLKTENEQLYTVTVGHTAQLTCIAALQAGLLRVRQLPAVRGEEGEEELLR